MRRGAAQGAGEGGREGVHAGRGGGRGRRERERKEGEGEEGGGGRVRLVEMLSLGSQRASLCRTCTCSPRTCLDDGEVPDGTPPHSVD